MKKGARLVTLDWDQECMVDFATGRGFEIYDKLPKKADDVKSLHCIQSQLFCSDWADDNAFAERYSCTCGDIKGKVHEGEVCPKCKTKIEFRGVDLKITGWMELKDYKIIQPIYFKKLESYIGPKKFEDIISYGKKIDKDGNIVDREQLVSKPTPYSGIGIIGLYTQYDEIIEYFAKDAFKKGKEAYYEELINDKRKVFASCIPVYSSVLRPASFKGDSFFYTSIDKVYNGILSLIMLLNSESEYSERRKKWKKDHPLRAGTPTIIYTIQKKLMKLWDLVHDQISQKEGFIRSEIMGGRLNFTSRNVIIPDATLRADEIDLNYMAVLELLKYEIISCISHMSNVSESQAYDQWYGAKRKYNQKIYEIMVHINQKFKPRFILNRNPTINYGSLFCVKLRYIKRDYIDDYTMSLPIPVLTPANADFDGDIFNLIACKTKRIGKAFDKNFNPAKNFYVSRNDGPFNPEMGLLKDQMIGLYDFNNI